MDYFGIDWVNKNNVMAQLEYVHLRPQTLAKMEWSVPISLTVRSPRAALFFEVLLVDQLTLIFPPDQ